MTFSMAELSAFFESLTDEMDGRWDIGVYDGQLTEHKMHRNRARMDAIGRILQQLADGYAQLSYDPPEDRAQAPMIWIPAGGGSDA